MRVALLSLALVACGPAPEDIATNLESPNPIVREDSAIIARQYDDEIVIAALIKALEDPSERVRLNAVDSLAEIGEEAAPAVPALIRIVQTDGSEEVITEAVDALGRIGDPAAVPVLIGFLQDRGADKPTLNAIWALGALEDDRALPLLAELRESDDPYVAWNAERALSTLKPSAEAADEAPAPTEAVAPDGGEAVEAPVEEPAEEPEPVDVNGGTTQPNGVWVPPEKEDEEKKDWGPSPF